MGTATKAMMTPRVQQVAGAAGEDRQRRRVPTSGVRAKVAPAARSGPLTAHEMIWRATKLSMMVTTTSWAPVKAFSQPGMKP